ncbi:MAG: hypothetical protein FWC75_07165 [Oscillospiraceae bacterium]|nr:hypothetical protein [Oscillospiraceae bacterium]
MICSCGTRYPDSDAHCIYCGARNAEYKPPEPASPTSESSDAGQPFDPWEAFPDKAPSPEQNTTQQQDHTRQQTHAHGQDAPPWAQQPSSWDQNQHENTHPEALFRRAKISAIISLVCGILGNIIGGPIFGLIAIFQGRRAKMLGYPGGMATAGIVLGIIAIVFWLFAMFFIFYVIPRVAPQLVPYINQVFPF